jgi:LmbE family N-acetylglucosaminyl deacetylase
MKKALAFGCHPDDVEFHCAGTLALLAKRGYEIHIAVMAGGEMGSATLPPQKIRAIRLQEAAKSAAVIGGFFHYAGGYDIEVEYNSEYRRRTIRVLREVNPSIVFTAPPTDYLIDHEETSRLVRNACFIAPVPNYDCGVPTKPTSAIPHLYYWNAQGLRDIWGHPLPLTCAANISAVMNTKKRMLACHATQRDWLAKHHRCDQYIEMMKQMSRDQGKLAGCAAAEGFIQHRGDGYPQDNILAKILGPLCVEL